MKARRNTHHFAFMAAKKFWTFSVALSASCFLFKM